MPTVAICYPIEPKHLDWLQQAAPECQFINAGQEGIADAVMNADLFIGHAKVPVDWDRVVRQGRLRWIQSSAAGLDHCLVPSVIESEITVCSASGLFAPQVAEQTMALLFGVLRRLPTFFNLGLQRRYERKPTDDLRGKRVGIVGMGGNGRRIVEVLAPFGNEIVATDYYPFKKPPELHELWGHDRLLELAARSDVLILTLPYNASTHHLINADILAAMPRGSYLINVARGQCVCESALVASLQMGHLAGAGLDVAEVEPLPIDSPLWGMEQVIITPHVGAQAASRVDDSTRLACENLRRYLEGRPLMNVVDKRLGFPHPDVLARNMGFRS